MKSYVGIIHLKGEDIFINPLYRKDKFSKICIKKKKSLHYCNGDVVIFDSVEKPSIKEKLGHIDDKDIFLKIAVHRNDIPTKFSKPLEESLKGLSVPRVGPKRVDLRKINFVTIDGDDAKDFDDAVFVEKTAHDEWKITVAIADVSYYVQPGSLLDEEAYERGNSVYFVNSVVPMLPSILSDDLCSLVPKKDRAVLCVDMHIDFKGNLKRSKFFRALIRSKERLTYAEVQNAINGVWDQKTTPLKEEITNLYTVYKILKKKSVQRGVLDINKPEYKIDFLKSGIPKNVKEVKTATSNEIIEELMVLANHCAGNVLQGKKAIFRVHPPVNEDRLASFEKLLSKQNIDFRNGGEKLPSKIFNMVLKKLEGKTMFHFIQDVILRCQQQAFYSTDNIGHAGLVLERYCHFTSPIRRYADLVVHRSLINVLQLDEEVYDLSNEDFEKVSEHISETERRAVSAERECFERYACWLLKKQEKAVMKGRITGISQQGLFVSLEGYGVEGFVRVVDMDDYYFYDEANMRFVGRKKKKVYQMGQDLTVQLMASDFIKCQLSLKIIDTQENNAKKRRIRK